MTDATIDELRDQAVAAWIATFPQDSRLDAFLAGVPAAHHREIRRSCRAIFEAASGLLEASAAAGPVEMAAFHAALREALAANFPWMGEAAFGALRSYTGWYAWHEGYAKREA